MLEYLEYDYMLTFTSVLHIFMLLVNVLSFQLEELTSSFLISQVYPSPFICLGKCLVLFHFWRTTLLGRIFLVGRVFYFLSALKIYHLTSFWPARFLLRNFLRLLYGFSCKLQVEFSLVASQILSLSLIVGSLIIMCNWILHWVNRITPWLWVQLLGHYCDSCDVIFSVFSMFLQVFHWCVHISNSSQFSVFTNWLLGHMYLPLTLLVILRLSETFYEYTCSMLLTPSSGWILKLIVLLLMLQHTRTDAGNPSSTFQWWSNAQVWSLPDLQIQADFQPMITRYLPKLTLTTIGGAHREPVKQEGGWCIQSTGCVCGPVGRSECSMPMLACGWTSWLSLQFSS